MGSSRRNSDFLLGKVTVDGGTVEITGDLALTDPLPAGTNNIGDVDVASAVASSVFQATGTVTTAGTRVALASNACVSGFYVTNTHASATVYVGTAAAVSSSAFIFRLAPGQSTPRIPLNNSNLVGIDASANGATVSYGGF